jgi:hypothetical protein
VLQGVLIQWLETNIRGIPQLNISSFLATQSWSVIKGSINFPAGISEASNPGAIFNGSIMGESANNTLSLNIFYSILIVKKYKFL